MSIIAITPIIYHPEYNVDTGEYYDVCPIPSRKQMPVMCFCTRDGKCFSTKTDYSYHIKLKTHRIYIQNYTERLTDIEIAKDYIKNILHKNRRLEYEVSRLTHKLKLLEAPTTTFLVELD